MFIPLPPTVSSNPSFEDSPRFQLSPIQENPTYPRNQTPTPWVSYHKLKTKYLPIQPNPPLPIIDIRYSYHVQFLEVVPKRKIRIRFTVRVYKASRYVSVSKPTLGFLLAHSLCHASRKPTSSSVQLYREFHSSSPSLGILSGVWYRYNGMHSLRKRLPPFLHGSFASISLFDNLIYRHFGTTEAS